MRFAFSEDQRALQASVRDVLGKECPPTLVRAAWSSETGRSAKLWKTLAEQGVLGLLVPEAHGGLGLSELDAVLVHEEAGRVALPEPLLETAAVAVPMLRNTALAGEWLPRIAAGDAVVAVGMPPDRLVTDAHVADLLLLAVDGTIHALPRGSFTFEAERSVDGARRLCRVTPQKRSPTSASLADGFDRGALAAAAQLLGLSAAMIDRTVDYVKTRKQFGVAIGSFQAVKHHLADATLALEFARPVVYRAADSMARLDGERSCHVSMAKAFASDAATRVAKAALQCHGAIGYSYEYDLHLFMKRAWALAAAWGDAAWHRARVGTTIFSSQTESHHG